jgi:hypothetical protein
MILKEILDEIRSSISRGKGTFGLAQTPAGQGKPFSLAVGSIRAVQVDRGFMIVLGLSRDQVVTLREMCDELLSAGSSPEDAS